MKDWSNSTPIKVETNPVNDKVGLNLATVDTMLEQVLPKSSELEVNEENTKQKPELGILF